MLTLPALFFCWAALAGYAPPLPYSTAHASPSPDTHSTGLPPRYRGFSLVAHQADNPDMGVTVADARFMKPLDVDLIRRLASEHDAMLTVEENAVGGFGAHVLHFMVLDGLMDDVRRSFRVMVSCY